MKQWAGTLVVLCPRSLYSGFLAILRGAASFQIYSHLYGPRLYALAQSVQLLRTASLTR